MQFIFKYVKITKIIFYKFIYSLKPLSQSAHNSILGEWVWRIPPEENWY